MSLWQDLRYTFRLGLLIGAAAATVGVIYGYDLPNVAGALLFITDQFHLSTFQQELGTTAVVVGEVAGAVMGGWLANRFGRKRCTVAIAASYAVFALLGALSVSVPMLLVARLLLGLTIGVSVVIAGVRGRVRPDEGPRGPARRVPGGEGRRHHCGIPHCGIPRRARLPLVEVVRAASATPATLLGLDHVGTLAPGYQADLVVLDAHLHVTDVMHHGRWLAPASHPTMQGHPGERRVLAPTTAAVAGTPQPEETSP